MSKEALISARNIKKSFQSGASTLEILKGVNLDIQPCEDVCIVGTSGAGKSTLLQILGTLDRPSEGELLFQGKVSEIKKANHSLTGQYLSGKRKIERKKRGKTLSPAGTNKLVFCLVDFPRGISGYFIPMLIFINKLYPAT